MERKFFTSHNEYSLNPPHRVSYIEWGDHKNSKILTCVHGLSRNARDFDFIAQALQNEYRIICVDVVGRGESQRLENKAGYNYQTYVADILNLLDHLEISKTDWLGTSMGGIIGMLISSEYSELINKLILNDIGPYLPAEPLKRINKYVALLPAFDSRSLAEEVLRFNLQTFGISNPLHMQHMCDISIKEQKDGTFAFNYDPGIVSAPNPETEFNPVNLWHIWYKIKIDLPIFILRGKMSDVLLKDTALEMLNTKTNIKMEEFDRIGHAPALLDPHQINLIANWLKNG